MKKIQFLLTFFAAILLGLTACQHSIDAPVPQEMAEHAFNPIALPSSDIEAKLRAFNDYLNSFQNAKSRDAQGMSTEQVEWNIEALLNATYANAAKGFTSQSVSRDSFLIPLNNSAVSSENVVNAWRSAKSLLHDQYVSVGEAGKHVVMIDISTKTLGSQLQLTVSSFIGINPVQSRTDPFTATDDWWWGKLGIGGTSGKCGNYSGQALGKVAVDRLNE